MPLEGDWQRAELSRSVTLPILRWPNNRLHRTAVLPLETGTTFQKDAIIKKEFRSPATAAEPFYSVRSNVPRPGKEPITARFEVQILGEELLSLLRCALIQCIAFFTPFCPPVGYELQTTVYSTPTILKMFYLYG